MFMFVGGQSLKKGLTSAKSGLETRRILLHAFWQAQEFNFFPVYGSGFRDEIQEMLPEQAGAALQLRGSQLSLHIVQELGCLPQAWVSTPGAQAFGSY